MGAVLEDIKWTPSVVVSKFSVADTREMTELLGHEPTIEDFAKYGVTPEDYAYAEGNILVTTGVTRIASLITGAGGNAFNAAQGYVGVGDGTTSPTTVGMTDLQGANKYYVPLAGAPTLAAGTFSVSALFGPSVANFAGGWQEWCFGIANSTNTAGTAAPAGIMLNRKPQNLGVKANGASWTLQASVTIS